jgi:hypothetical protein
MARGVGTWPGARRSILGALLAGALVHASAWAEDPAVAPEHRTQRSAAKTSLEGRVRLLTKALNLDAGQQEQLKKVLERERDRVAKLWSDPTAPAAYRIAATQAASELTADEIRVFLNEEQRRRYKPARSSANSEASSKVDVEAWMNATHHR